MNDFFKKAMRGQIFFEPISFAVASFLFFDAGFAVGTAIFIGEAVVAVLTIGALIGATTIIGGALGQKAGSGPSLADEGKGRTQLIREPVTSRKVIYGEIKVSGPTVFIDSTSNNRFHHIVIALAGHECQKIGTVYFNDNPIFEDHIDVFTGEVNAGIYSGFARIKKHLGSISQIADPELVAEVEKWTNNHRGQGVCYLYIRIDFDRDVYPTGIPNISAIVQGKKLFDSRDAVTRFSPNSALCIRDYLTNSTYGVGIADVAIDKPSFDADANSCEEFVSSGIHNHDVDSIDTTTDELSLDGANLKFTTGNKVLLTNETFLSLPGESGDFASSPDSVALSVVGFIDIRLDVSFDDWTPAFQAAILSKWLSAGDERSFLFSLNIDGTLKFHYSPDGISWRQPVSTIPTGFVNGSRHFIRMTFNPDNGATQTEGKFYISDVSIDGPWTQLGTTITQGGTSFGFDSIAQLEIGSREIGTTAPAKANFYRAQVYDNTTLVFDADFTAEDAGTTSFNEDANNAVVTINQSGSPQAEIVGDLPAPLLLDTDYFVIVSSIAGRMIKLATTLINATDGIPIDITDSGIGTHTITREVQHEIIGVDTVLDSIQVNEEILLFQTGDKVQVRSTGTVPGGLAVLTDYFAIIEHEQNITDDDEVVQFDASIKFAVNYLDALTGIQIPITSGGTGTRTVVKVGEPRFTCNGMIDTKINRFAALTDLLTSMGGTVTKIGATWKSYAAIFRSAEASFNEDDVIGEIKTPTKTSRSSRFNRVRGTYISPKNQWEPQDYPAQTKTQFQVDDGNEIIDISNFDLPFTTRSQTAQRLAQIFLKRSRQEIITEVKLKLKGLEAQGGNNIKFSNIVRGWTDKLFQVTVAEFSPENDINGTPFFASTLRLRETASTDFDFDPDVDEIIVDANPNSDLPSPFFIQTPGGLLVTEEIYEGRAGAGVKTRINVVWNPAVDAFNQFFQVEHKLNTESVFIKQPATQENEYQLNDIRPGIYDVRVKAINSLGISSGFVSAQIQVFGLLSEPENPQNMTITIVGGSAYIRWDQVADLDVRVGGQILFRQSKRLTGATWQESVSIGEQVGGAETLVVLPLKEGTYLAKSKDSLGVLSLMASSATTKQASIQDYTTSGTINEHPNFVGGHNGTRIDGANNLRLIGGDLFDSWADIDSVADFDIGFTGVNLTKGIYTFAAAFDLGSIMKRRVTTLISAININIFNFIDDVLDDIDTWPDFDGTGTEASADAEVWMRQTDDDPTGSPTWGPFERIESVEVEAWGLEFQARLVATVLSIDILIDELTVKQETLI